MYKMTPVKTYKKHTPVSEMMDRRIAWLKEDGPQYIIFEIYSREGDEKYTQTIRKSDLHTTCNCKYAEKWGRNDPNGCWHMRRAMYSYLLRIQRSEVE
jgi:hypothetical protein